MVNKNSGQRVAEAMKLPILSEGDLLLIEPLGMADHTPLTGRHVHGSTGAVVHADERVS